jgi:hypothetical protein
MDNASVLPLKAHAKSAICSWKPKNKCYESQQKQFQQFDCLGALIEVSNRAKRKGIKAKIEATHLTQPPNSPANRITASC